MLELKEVGVNFGGKWALDQVSFTIPDGEIVAILGASGSGKSTLLRTVAGLEYPARGDVYWNGQNLSPVPIHLRRFGLMFQDGQLFNNRTVAQNVAYPLQMKQSWWQSWRRKYWPWPGTETTEASSMKETVQQLLELVGLPDYADRAVTTLSGGQAQRVALARCLAMKPQLLLLDEPLSALDRAWRQSLVTQLRQIIKQQQISALYVTHDQEEAFAVADRLVILEQGRIIGQGTTTDLAANPRTVAVAKFFGYHPILNQEQAAEWGIRITDRQVLALAPGALRVLPSGKSDRGRKMQVQERQVFRSGIRYRLRPPERNNATIPYLYLADGTKSENTPLTTDQKYEIHAEYRIGPECAWESAPQGQEVWVEIAANCAVILDKDPKSHY